MALIGIDTSTNATSVCVVHDGAVAEHIPAVGDLHAPPAHAVELLPRVDELLRQAGASFDDVEALAIGSGPGGFTGLRIGFATVRAIASARSVGIRPVSSLAALAAAIEAPVALPLIDARRGELFAALYRDGEPLLEPFAARPEELLERLPGGAEKPFAAGDGSLRFRAALAAAGITVAPEGSPLHVVRALHVCRLAQTVPAVRPEAALPTYLRDPDATPLP